VTVGHVNVTQAEGYQANEIFMGLASGATPTWIGRTVPAPFGLEPWVASTVPNTTPVSALVPSTTRRIGGNSGVGNAGTLQPAHARTGLAAASAPFAGSSQDKYIQDRNLKPPSQAAFLLCRVWGPVAAKQGGLQPPSLVECGALT